jgi:hypothetical protein
MTGQHERTWERVELRRPQIQVVLNPEAEHLCRVWAEVARAVLKRRERDQGDRCQTT